MRSGKFCVLDIIPYRKTTGMTTGSARKTTNAAANEARRQNGGGSAASFQRRARRIPRQHATPSSNASSKASDRGVSNFTPIRNVLPPIRDQVADFARRRRHMVRQLCPSHVGVNVGDRLKQDGRKILAADILYSVQQILNPQIGGIDCCLRSRQQA